METIFSFDRLARKKSTFHLLIKVYFFIDNLGVKEICWVVPSLHLSSSCSNNQKDYTQVIQLNLPAPYKNPFQKSSPHFLAIKRACQKLLL